LIWLSFEGKKREGKDDEVVDASLVTKDDVAGLLKGNLDNRKLETLETGMVKKKRRVNHLITSFGRF